MITVPSSCLAMTLCAARTQAYKEVGGEQVTGKGVCSQLNVSPY